MKNKSEENGASQNMATAKCLLSVVVLFLVVGCGDARNQNRTTNKNEEDSMATSGDFAITSSAFKEGGMIPKQYSGEGQNFSPPLKWSSAPAQTKSLALIVDDPDAPAGTWVHWVIFNIPPTTTELQEKVPTKDSLADGALQGKNSSGEIGYDGPYPPGGTHRYYFKLYALDTMLNLSPGITKSDLLKAMEGHIVVQAQLMGRYSR